MQRSTFVLAYLFLTVLLLPASATAGDCSFTSSTVSITSGPDHACPSSLTAAGSWAINNADGVSLKFYVDGQLIQEETRFASSGSWSLSDTWYQPDDTYTLTVDAFPMVDNGSGYTTCLLDGSTDSDDFAVHCTLDPEIGSCFQSSGCGFFGGGPCELICAGSVSDGTSPYRVYWHHSDGTFVSTTSSSSFMSPQQSPFIICDSGDTLTLTVKDDADRYGSDTMNCP